MVCSGSMPTEPAFFRSSSHAMPMTGRLDGYVAELKRAIRREREGYPLSYNLRHNETLKI